MIKISAVRHTHIENPVINSPFVEPTRHFRFTDEGITDEIMEGRRSSAYFIPIARPKKKGKQLAFDTDWTQDRIEENRFVNQVRERVKLWREGGYVIVSADQLERLQQAKIIITNFHAFQLRETVAAGKLTKAAKVTTARTLWVPAINNHGGLGRWGFLEIADPWDAKNLIRTSCHKREVGA